MGGTYAQRRKRPSCRNGRQHERDDGRHVSGDGRLMMGRDMRAMDPRELLYWGVMSLGIGVGFVTAYPINWWLVRKGLKHGLMTERAREGPAATVTAPPLTAASGHRAQPRLDRAIRTKDVTAMRAHDAHAGHDSGCRPPSRGPGQIAAMASFTALVLVAGFAYPFVNA